MILHFQILAKNSDRFANLVQWFSYAGGMIAISLIAAEMGAYVFVQNLSALILASAPMTILQATSTQNALVCGYFIAIAVYFTLVSLKKSDFSNLFYLALASALAIETKGIAYFYLPAFLIWLGLVLLRRRDFKALTQIVLMSLFFIIALNAPTWSRNFSVWNNIFGEKIIFDDMASPKHSLPILTSNMIRNMALHMGTPSEKLNNALTKIIDSIHKNVLHLDSNDRETTYLDLKFSVFYSLADENYSGNPLHFFLFLLACFFLLNPKKKTQFMPGFLICLFLGFVLFCFQLRWEPYHSRIHTPLFMLMAVPTGIGLGTLFEGRFTKFKTLILVLFAVASIPWLFLNYTRALIDLPAKKRWSILTHSREEIYFFARPKLYPAFSGVMDELAKHPECKIIGLKVGGDSWEYPFYMMSELRGLGVRFKTVFVENGSALLAPDPSSQVCGVIVLEQADDFMKSVPAFKSMSLVYLASPIKFYLRNP